MCACVCVRLRVRDKHSERPHTINMHHFAQLCVFVYLRVPLCCVCVHVCVHARVRSCVYDVCGGACGRMSLRVLVVFSCGVFVLGGVCRAAISGISDVTGYTPLDPNFQRLGPAHGARKTDANFEFRLSRTPRVSTKENPEGNHARSLSSAPRGPSNSTRAPAHVNDTNAKDTQKC